jgi:hypothetical protein
MIGALVGYAQDKNTPVSVAHETFKIIPDKIFEIAVPLIFVFLLLNLLVSYLKSSAENKIKLKMIEKDISEESLNKVFKESNAIRKMQPLKWFLFSLANGLAILILFFLRHTIEDSSGYFAISVIILFNASASFFYYKLLSKKL